VLSIENAVGNPMGKRILVADDSQTIQTAFAMVLGAEHTLVVARSVDEAISAAKAGRPDLVIADAALGSASGYDLCAALKADPGLRSVPIHILTSNHNPYDEARGGRAGADGFMVKPFDSQALIDGVAAALAAPGKLASTPSASPSRPVAESMFGGMVPDVAAEDEDSYGEITIERSPAAPGPASWAGRPAARPSGGRPVVPTPVVSPVPATVVARPSLIPGTRPSATGIPVARTAAPGIVPAPAVPPPTTISPVPRSMANRTMMGFPAVAAGATPGAPIPPVARPVVPARTPLPPTAPVVSPAAVPPRVPTATPPRAPVSPAASLVPPIAPPAPGMAPWRPAAPPSVPATPVAAPVVATSTLPPPAVAAAVASAVDSKMASLAARGPEYEAIAKLSREIIEQVVWEVVPELAELIIKQEVDRLASAKR
jgi:CheY-like chemotaxis protein